MIKRIKADPILSKFIGKECCENNICVTFADDVDMDNVVIVKVDKYYESLKMEFTPPSIDCLIIRKCLSGGYALTLVELKKTKKQKHLDVKNLKEKFHTTINEFIKTTFYKYYDIDYKNVKLYFVSNIENDARDKGIKLETRINDIYHFRGRRYLIQPELPNPTINNCQ